LKSIDIIGFTVGGKKYGQLKAKQENELEFINQVINCTR